MNPENIYAFLISVEKYTGDEQLHKLTQSFNNVKALDSVFKSNSFGIKNIETEHNPTEAAKLIQNLKNFIKSDDAKTLIIYYSGHGILDDDGTHYLTLTTSTVDGIGFDGLDILKLNKAFKEKKNLKIILILDSCFSESAFQSFEARNCMVIASSAMSKTSKYPKDQEYSAFTNELIDVLQNGIENQEDYLTWRDVYSQLKNNLEKNRHPLPKISVQNEVDKLEIGKNNFYDQYANMDEQWVPIIKKFGRNNPIVNQEIMGILNAQSSQTVKRLQGLLMNSFPFPIAYHLNRVFQKNPAVDIYFNFYESIIRFLFMVGFINYESLKLTKGFKSDDKYRKQYLKPNHDFYFSLLKTLATDFLNNKPKWFLTEFDYFDKNFQDVINDLEKQKKQKVVSPADVRTNIFKLIPQLDFLINYKLLSVKDVNLSYRKYDPLFYNHSVSKLQGIADEEYKVWHKMDEEWQRSFVKNEIAKNNRSVIFVKCCDPKNIEYLNLWPLIIDKNTLDPKSYTPRIYLFAGKDDNNDYVYQSIKDSDTMIFDDLESLTPDPENKIKHIANLFEG